MAGAGRYPAGPKGTRSIETPGLWTSLKPVWRQFVSGSASARAIVTTRGDLGLRAERASELHEQRRDPTAVARARARELSVEPTLDEDLSDPNPAALEGTAPPSDLATSATSRRSKGSLEPAADAASDASCLAGAGAANRQESAGTREPQLGSAVDGRTPQALEQRRCRPRRQPACRSGAHDLVLVGGAEQPLEERRDVGVVCDGRRLDETSASGVVGMALEPALRAPPRSLGRKRPSARS